MNFGKNLQHLRRLAGMTQEALAEKLDVSRQTVSKWEMDASLPEMEKSLELCTLFKCTLDDLFRTQLDVCDAAYSGLRTEVVPAFRYVRYTVISPEPEQDALERMRRLAKENGTGTPKLIGWDFPCLSPEQINVHHLHGYTAAWILPEGVTPVGWEVFSQPTLRYAAIHIERPFDMPFTVIPNAYRTLMEYMSVNGLAHLERDVIPCFETAGDTMDVYIACK